MIEKLFWAAGYLGALSRHDVLLGSRWLWTHRVWSDDNCREVALVSENGWSWSEFHLLLATAGLRALGII